MFIIYRVENKVNGKCYIGQTCRLIEKRIKEHLTSKINRNTYFHKALNKYGLDNFTWKTIRECSNKKEANEQETYFIKFFNSKVPNGYNLTDGGEGKENYVTSEITRKKNIQKHRK